MPVLSKITVRQVSICSNTAGSRTMIPRRAASEMLPIIATGMAINSGQGVATTSTARNRSGPSFRPAAIHAAAAMASNFLIALEEAAAELLGDITPDARELLAPLVLRTAANWSERGPAALTGPIARGDTATVERHLEALRERAPELVPLYEALAERTRALAGGQP